MDDRIERWKEEYNSVEPPRELKDRVLAAMEQAAKDSSLEAGKKSTVDFEKKKARLRRRKWAAAAAACLFILCLPNLSVQAAQVMGDIPLLGRFFQVITVRNYKYDDGHSSAAVAQPQVAVTTSETAALSELNSQTGELIDRLLQEFEQTKAGLGDGYQRLDVDYQVVCDTDTWFTLKIDATRVMASGAQEVYYYHLDKTTGRLATLKDICRPDVDYVEVLTREIKAQMKKQMEDDPEVAYFYTDEDTEESFEGDFEQIAEDQNFYFNDNGQLVIAFNEYEVAPGYMGCPEFVIPDEVYAGIKK